MIWFLERDTDLAICEIRPTLDQAGYEFEVTSPDSPPVVQRFDTPRDLITGYLDQTSRLRAAGWHPRAALVDVVED